MKMDGGLCNGGRLVSIVARKLSVKLGSNQCCEFLGRHTVTVECHGSNKCRLEPLLGAFEMHYLTVHSGSIRFFTVLQTRTL